MDNEKRHRMVEYMNKYCDDKMLVIKLEERAFKSIEEFILLNINYIHQYNQRCKYIIRNMKNIVDKEINPDDIFSVSSRELLPLFWMDSEKRYNEEEKFLYGKKKKANTTTVTCRGKKCFEKNIFVSYKQLRSADEPETCFFECLSCGHKWRK